MNQRKKRERITDAERKEAYKEASRFVLDIAKLVFAGVILGSIMDMDINKGFVFGVGLIIVICLITLGGLLYYFAIKKILAYGIFSSIGNNDIMHSIIRCMGSNIRTQPYQAIRFRAMIHKPTI